MSVPPDQLTARERAAWLRRKAAPRRRADRVSVAVRTGLLSKPCTIPLIPLGQLFAADFPEITFPAGKDIAQLMWRGLADRNSIEVIWQRSTDITGIQSPPTAELDEEFGSTITMSACILDPERISDLPYYEELPHNIREQLVRWRPEPEDTDEQHHHGARQHPPSLYYQLSAAPGFKIGGSMNWSTSDMPDLICPDCKAPTSLLLQLDTYEWPPQQPDSPWRPLQDCQLVPGTPHYELACEPTGLTIGRAGRGGVFTCSVNPEHSAQFICQ
ncbi:hypothetical protein [Nocardia tengchongensis]|uniref:hypothetical protein n=1 Tax=Nocardia tengchongensis TaxID=2055889 RepID=UPI00361165A2